MRTNAEKGEGVTRYADVRTMIVKCNDIPLTPPPEDTAAIAKCRLIEVTVATGYRLPA